MNWVHVSTHTHTHALNYEIESFMRLIDVESDVNAVNTLVSVKSYLANGICSN